MASTIANRHSWDQIRSAECSWPYIFTAGHGLMLHLPMLAMSDVTFAHACTIVQQQLYCCCMNLTII